jgi:hypothetical protein
MVAGLLGEKNIDYLLRATANLISCPRTKMWLDYDAEADVLSAL